MTSLEKKSAGTSIGPYAGIEDTRFSPTIVQYVVMSQNTSLSVEMQYQSITAMKKYEAKSFEELRMTCYSAWSCNDRTVKSVNNTFKSDFDFSSFISDTTDSSLLNAGKHGKSNKSAFAVSDKEDNLEYLTVANNQPEMELKKVPGEPLDSGVSCTSLKRLSPSITRIYPCQRHIADFIVKCLSLQFTSVRLDKVKEGVEISGSNINVNEVNKILGEKLFKEGCVTFSAPRLKFYFRDCEWISFVDDIQKEFRCCVSVMENGSKRFCNFMVAIKHGDITKENTDAIINGIRGDFNLPRGTVSSAVFGNGGMEMQNCIHNPSTFVLPSFARVTKGFNLPCKHVIHIITPSSVDELIVRMKFALDFAEQHNFKSLSLPTLGAGNVGISPLQVATAMHEAFKQFDAESPCHLKAINVIVFESSFLPLFQEKLLFASESNECDDSTTPTLERMTVLTISDVSWDAAQAAERIEQHKSRVFGEEEILASGKINLLEDCDKQDIRELSTLCGVCVQFIHTGPPKIELCGFKESVWIVKKQIEAILEECVLARITANDHVWKWETEKGNFSYLPLRVSHQIEKKYKEKEVNEIFLCFRGVIVTFNLSSMSYSIPKQEKTGKLFRDYTKIEGLPNNWEFMRGKYVGKYVVDPLSEEYRLVENKFGTSFPGTLIQIERIQNISLYRQYCMKKNSVERNMTSNRPVERELFHGTSVDIANRICFDGFDRGFAGKNAAAFGKGTYFALNSEYSVRYSPPDPSGRRYMFLARVLTGEYCQGQRHYMVPPTLPQQREDGVIRTYDSAVNNVSNPTIFVVFKDSSAYPEYLITFSSSLPSMPLGVTRRQRSIVLSGQSGVISTFFRNVPNKK